MQRRSLGDLRDELATRLNMAGQALSPASKKLLNSFLREANDFLVAQYEWPELRRDWVFPLVAGKTLYPLPTDSCSYTPDVMRIQNVYVENGAQWLPLEQGIEPWRYTFTARGIPSRYDIAHGNSNPDVQPPGLVSP